MTHDPQDPQAPPDAITAENIAGTVPEFAVPDHTAAGEAAETEHAADTTIDGRTGHCFGCGPANPQGLQLTFTWNPEAFTATAIVRLDRIHEGAPGYIHGGIIATLMDEAMSKLNKLFGTIAMTRHLEVDYLRPAPLNTDLILVGHHLSRQGRKLFHEAGLQTTDGIILARSKGLFIALDPEVIAAARSKVLQMPARPAPLD